MHYSLTVRDSERTPLLNAGSSNCHRTCNKAKFLIATTLLLGGVAALAYGTNALINQVAGASITIAANVDPGNFRAWETVSFNLDTDALYQNGAIALSGLFSTILSAGLLLGMSCQKRD